MSSGKARPNTKGSLLRKKGDGERNPLLPKDARVQNARTANVYVFGDADVEEEEIHDDSHEMSEVRPRGNARSQRREKEPPEVTEPDYIERSVAEGDTLQSVALKFGVPVSVTL